MANLEEDTLRRFLISPPVENRVTQPARPAPDPPMRPNEIGGCGIAGGPNAHHALRPHCYALRTPLTALKVHRAALFIIDFNL